MASQGSRIYWATRPLRSYAKFSGRAPRPEFWHFLTMITATVLAVALVGLPFLAVPVLLVVAIPLIAVTVRRLHDTGRSGVAALLPMASFLVLTTGAFLNVVLAMGSETFLAYIFVGSFATGLLVLAIWLGRTGTPGPNRFGPDPLGSEHLAEVFE